MILLVIIYIGIFLAVLGLAIFFLDLSLRAPRHRGPTSDHFDGKTFKSLGDMPNMGEGRGRWDVLKWMISRDKNVWVDAEVRKSVPERHVEGSRIVATFVNHATVLIQTEGLNIITDPVYADHAGPFLHTGPKRHAEPGVDFDDLPPIDVVLLSHNHYDHLDIATLRRLEARFHPLVIVPLGNAAYLEGKGIKVAKELDWWQEAPLATASANNASFHFVPSQHFSARALSDRDKTLWGGYVIRTPHGDIYFAGDTGYGPFVQEIKLRFPNGFRLGLLPIGAYEPVWFMGPVHISPDEAFAMKKELAIRDAMAIHFGTFKLADDAQDAAPMRLQELVVGDPSMAGTFKALMNGQSMEVRE